MLELITMVTTAAGALTLGVGTGFLMLEGVLVALRSAVSRANGHRAAAAPSNVVSMRARADAKAETSERIAA